MICNNFTDQWYRVILSQYLNNFYTEFLPITDTIGVNFSERGKNIFKYGLGWPWALWSNSIYLLDITKIYSKTRSLFYRSINCFMILMKKSIRFKVCRQCERRMAAVIYLILDNVKVGAVAETENVGLFSPIFWLYSQVCRQWEKEREREIEIGATTIYNVIQYGADSVWLCSRVRTSDKKREQFNECRSAPVAFAFILSRAQLVLS